MADASGTSHPSSGAGRRLWAVIRSAPLTFLWLAVLLVTMMIQHALSPESLDAVLGSRSTNLHNLTTNPLHALFTSLFWIDGSYWFPYVLMYCVFHVPAERWLGSLRWLTVGVSAHVLATFISEGLLALAIHDGVVSSSMVDIRDVGVSHFLAGIVGVLTYRIARPWRWVYLAGALASYGLPLFTSFGMTAIGHFSSLLIGLMFYPITRGRPAVPWNPVDAVRAWRTRAPTTGLHRVQDEPMVRHKNS